MPRKSLERYLANREQAKNYEQPEVRGWQRDPLPEMKLSEIVRAKAQAKREARGQRRLTHGA